MLLWLSLFFITTYPIQAQTGNINGRVETAANGTLLRGADILLIDTDTGGSTDSNGIYMISNILPGTYSLRALYIGYAQTTITDIKIYPGQTTNINFILGKEVLKGEEVTIIAERELIRPGISANTINLDAANLENLPIATIEDAVGLQAGVEPNMTIRGGNINSTSFIVDGINLREGRTNGPITGLSYTAVEQIQVQTSGFDAAYGNVRSGLVQIVTKDPPKDRFIADLFIRNRSAQRLNFPGEWKTINDAGNNLDLTLGGPLSQRFGKLRFLTSYRKNTIPYLEQFGEHLRQDETFQIKLISNIKPCLLYTSDAADE